MYPSPWTQVCVKTGGDTTRTGEKQMGVLRWQSKALQHRGLRRSARSVQGLFASHRQRDVDRHGLRDLFHAEVVPLPSSPTQPLPFRSPLPPF